jgi:hypothetical protein
MEPTQPPNQWKSKIISQGVSDRSVKLTTDLQLVPRTTMRGCVHELHHTPSWHSARLRAVQHLTSASDNDEGVTISHLVTYRAPDKEHIHLMRRILCIILWNVTPCSPVEFVRHLGGTHCLRHQGCRATSNSKFECRLLGC